MSKAISDLIEISQYAGTRVDYTQGGGGNTSVKDGGVMYIKASGFKLKDIDETTAYVPMDLDKIKSFFESVDLSDGRDYDALNKQVTAEATLKLEGLAALRPSVEVGFHSVLKKYVIHTHSVYANLLTCAVKGKELAEKTPVKVTDASGKPLAEVTLGERHEKWGMGRYAEFSGAAVLVSDTLDAFGDDPKSWCDTKIVDEPRISFTKLAAPDLADDVTGFATGVVAKVKIGDDTNRVATVGAKVKDGSGRYLKVDGMKWIFEVPDYSVSSLLPKPEEPKSEEPKAEDAKPEEPKAEEPKPEL